MQEIRAEHHIFLIIDRKTENIMYICRLFVTTVASVFPQARDKNHQFCQAEH